MTSLVIDLALMVALVVTALRSGRMYRELRALRQSGGDLGASLAEAEAALNHAARAVIALKHEGVDTLKALEAERRRAQDAEERLRHLVQRADFHAGQTPRPAAQAVSLRA